jgi:hypothetical protein
MARDKRFESSLVSYVLAQDNLDSHLQDLRKFLLEINIKLDLESLRREVYKIKEKLQKPRKFLELKASLFTKDRYLRKYRFGSDFCPSCKIFKNYEKECPYCGYLELTK